MIFTLPPQKGVPLPNYCLETSEGGRHDVQSLMVKGLMSSLEQSGDWGGWHRAGQGRWGFKPVKLHCVIEGQGQRRCQCLLKLKPRFLYDLGHGAVEIVIHHCHSSIPLRSQTLISAISRKQQPIYCTFIMCQEPGWGLESLRIISLILHRHEMGSCPIWMLRLRG